MREERVVVSLNREPSIRSGDDPVMSDPSNLVDEVLLTVTISHMFDDSVRVDKVVGAICKGQTTSISSDVLFPPVSHLIDP